MMKIKVDEDFTLNVIEEEEEKPYIKLEIVNDPQLEKNVGTLSALEPAEKEIANNVKKESTSPNLNSSHDSQEFKCIVNTSIKLETSSQDLSASFSEELLSSNENCVKTELDTSNNEYKHGNNDVQTITKEEIKEEKDVLETHLGTNKKCIEKIVDVTVIDLTDSEDVDLCNNQRSRVIVFNTKKSAIDGSNSKQSQQKSTTEKVLKNNGGQKDSSVSPNLQKGTNSPVINNNNKRTIDNRISSAEPEVKKKRLSISEDKIENVPKKNYAKVAPIISLPKPDISEFFLYKPSKNLKDVDDTKNQKPGIQKSPVLSANKSPNSKKRNLQNIAKKSPNSTKQSQSQQEKDLDLAATELVARNMTENQFVLDSNLKKMKSPERTPKSIKQNDERKINAKSPERHQKNAKKNSEKINETTPKKPNQKVSETSPVPEEKFEKTEAENNKKIVQLLRSLMQEEDNEEVQKIGAKLNNLLNEGDSNSDETGQILSKILNAKDSSKKQVKETNNETNCQRQNMVNEANKATEATKKRVLSVNDLVQEVPTAQIPEDYNRSRDVSSSVKTVATNTNGKVEGQNPLINNKIDCQKKKNMVNEVNKATKGAKATKKPVLSVDDMVQEVLLDITLPKMPTAQTPEDYNVVSSTVKSVTTNTNRRVERQNPPINNKINWQKKKIVVNEANKATKGAEATKKRVLSVNDLTQEVPLDVTLRTMPTAQTPQYYNGPRYEVVSSNMKSVTTNTNRRVERQNPQINNKINWQKKKFVVNEVNKASKGAEAMKKPVLSVNNLAQEVPLDVTLQTMPTAQTPRHYNGMSSSVKTVTTNTNTEVETQNTLINNKMNWQKNKVMVNEANNAPKGAGATKKPVLSVNDWTQEVPLDVALQPMPTAQTRRHYNGHKYKVVASSVKTVTADNNRKVERQNPPMPKPDKVQIVNSRKLPPGVTLQKVSPAQTPEKYQSWQSEVGSPGAKTVTVTVTATNEKVRPNPPNNSTSRKVCLDRISTNIPSQNERDTPSSRKSPSNPVNCASRVRCRSHSSTSSNSSGYNSIPRKNSESSLNSEKLNSSINSKPTYPFVGNSSENNPTREPTLAEIISRKFKKHGDRVGHDRAEPSNLSNFRDANAINNDNVSQLQRQSSDFYVRSGGSQMSRGHRVGPIDANNSEPNKTLKNDNTVKVSVNPIDLSTHPPKTTANNFNRLPPPYVPIKPQVDNRKFYNPAPLSPTKRRRYSETQVRNQNFDRNATFTTPPPRAPPVDPIFGLPNYYNHVYPVPGLGQCHPYNVFASQFYQQNGDPRRQNGR